MVHLAVLIGPFPLNRYQSLRSGPQIDRVGARPMFRTRVGRKLHLVKQGDWHSFLKRVATRQSVGCKLQETFDNGGTAAGKRKSLMASERQHWIWSSDQRGNGSHKRTEWVCLRLCFARRGAGSERRRLRPFGSARRGRGRGAFWNCVSESESELGCLP